MSAQIPYVKFPIYPLTVLIGATPKDSRETYLHFAADAGDTGGETPRIKFAETQRVVISDNLFNLINGVEHELEQRVIYLNTNAGGSFTYIVPGDVTIYTSDDASPYYLGGDIYSFPSGTEVTWATSNDLVQIGEPALYFNAAIDGENAISVPFSGKYYYGEVYDGFNGGTDMTLLTINVETGIATAVYISSANSPGTGRTVFPMLFSHIISSVLTPGTANTSQALYSFPFCGKEMDVAIPGNLGDLSGFVLPTFEED